MPFQLRSFFFWLIWMPFCTLCLAETDKEKSTSYNQSLYVSNEIWALVQDYLMPDDHPAKQKLDQIFSNSRVLADMASMVTGGFAYALPQHHTGIIVTKHIELPGYMIKAYLDEHAYHDGKPEHHFWIKRVRGSRLVQESINKHHYHHLLKVPKKWIYLLPDEPSPPPNYLRKMFILVEEDMEIFDDKQNEELWGSEWVDKKLLKAIYTLTTEISLSDSTKPENSPFSKDGRVAFVDTQTFYTGYVKYDRLTPYLSPPMQKYWKKLTKNKNNKPQS